MELHSGVSDAQRALAVTMAAQRHRAHDISWSIVYLPTNSQHVQPSREGRRRLPLYPRLPGRQIYPLQVLQVLPRTLARPQADGTMGRSVIISLNPTE